MTIRAGGLSSRHRRSSRAAFLIFWMLLLAAHLTGMKAFFLAVALALLAELVLKNCDIRRMAKKHDGSGRSGPYGKVPNLRDREIDGLSSNL